MSCIYIQPWKLTHKNVSSLGRGRGKEKEYWNMCKDKSRLKQKETKSPFSYNLVIMLLESVKNDIWEETGKFYHPEPPKYDFIFIKLFITKEFCVNRCSLNNWISAKAKHSHPHA